jgi:hypothetical protein
LRGGDLGVDGGDVAALGAALRVTASVI